MSPSRSKRTHPPHSGKTHPNPVVHISQKSWGKGPAYTRYRIYYVKPTSKFFSRFGSRQVSREWASTHPRSVFYRYAFVSKHTGRRIKPEHRIDKSGERAWVEQGFLETSIPVNLTKPSSQKKWAANLYKTLSTYRRLNLPPEGSDDLDRFMDWVKTNRSDFYEALVEKRLAPPDPSFFTPDIYSDMEPTEADEA